MGMDDTSNLGKLMMQKTGDRGCSTKTFLIKLSHFSVGQEHLAEDSVGARHIEREAVAPLHLGPGVLPYLKKELLNPFCEEMRDVVRRGRSLIGPSDIAPETMRMLNGKIEKYVSTMQSAPAASLSEEAVEQVLNSDAFEKRFKEMGEKFHLVPKEGVKAVGKKLTKYVPELSSEAATELLHSDAFEERFLELLEENVEYVPSDKEDDSLAVETESLKVMRHLTSFCERIIEKMEGAYLAGEEEDEDEDEEQLDGLQIQRGWMVKLSSSRMNLFLLVTGIFCLIGVVGYLALKHMGML